MSSVRQLMNQFIIDNVSETGRYDAFFEMIYYLVHADGEIFTSSKQQKKYRKLFIGGIKKQLIVDGNRDVLDFFDDVKFLKLYNTFVRWTYKQM